MVSDGMMDVSRAWREGKFPALVEQGEQEAAYGQDLGHDDGEAEANLLPDGGERFWPLPAEPFDACLICFSFEDGGGILVRVDVCLRIRLVRMVAPI